jgi:hypothetical protein
MQRGREEESGSERERKRRNRGMKRERNNVSDKRDGEKKRDSE